MAIKEYLPTALALREDGTMVLPRSTEMAEEFVWGRDRFVEEARTLVKFDRAPAIVRVYDFLEAHGTAYMVMALLEGETLGQRLKREGHLASQAIERLLPPLLDGLEEIHAAGFLHRDIKPDNVLLDMAGNPTLIDFGASRAAMAGRTTAMTAIFTPGYAAAEQFTSAKQGPWTDIYGLSATMYHAITGAPPPSAFDRMVDDEYRPLAKLLLAGFSPGLLIGIDAGLAMRANDRPQSIAGWRATFAPESTPVALAKLALAGRRKGLWIGLATTAMLALAGGSYYLATDRPTATASQAGTTPTGAGILPVNADKVSQEKEFQEATAERTRQQEEQEELAQLRAKFAALEKAEAEAALKHQVEEETRRKVEAERTEKQQLEREAQLKGEAEAAAKRKAEEQDPKAAEAGETALRLSVVDRQHLQVALTSLGFNTSGADGVFGSRSRDMISAWQKARSYPATGYFTAAEDQALLKEASTAIAKFDDEQRKAAEETKKKADKEKAKAEVAAKVAVPPPPPPPTAPPAAATPRRSLIPNSSKANRPPAHFGKGRRCW